MIAPLTKGKSLWRETNHSLLSSIATFHKLKQTQDKIEKNEY